MVGFLIFNYMVMFMSYNRAVIPLEAFGNCSQKKNVCCVSQYVGAVLQKFDKYDDRMISTMLHAEPRVSSSNTRYSGGQMYLYRFMIRDPRARIVLLKTQFAEPKLYPFC